MFFYSHQACLRSLQGWAQELGYLLTLSCNAFVCTQFYFSLRCRARLGLPHPLTLGLTHCIYDHSLDPMGIHFFCCAHSGESIVSHDVVRDVFASIVRVVNFHVLPEQTHVLPQLSF
jgi:hypothetical protein